ncbi:MAG: hypothetical protein HYR56_34650 [Acidobacteria bacterium]|nr:hypothetical protein [Acidobacteriota bacterium]MBI3423611.1 hypothetical protein [Acidobacteriota bacterium]
MDFPFGVRVLIVSLLVASVGGLLWVRFQPSPAPRVIVSPSPSALTLLQPPTRPAPSPTVTPTPQPRRRGPVSPFEMRRYVRTHNQSSDFSLLNYWQRLGIQDDRFSRPYCMCEADIFRLPLDAESGDETMLRIFTDGLCRYLIFKPIDSSNHHKWKFLGKIDIEQRWHPPPHRLIRRTNQQWLVITPQTGHGTGFGMWDSNWYEITSRGIKQVLNYPVERYMSGGGAQPEIFFSTTTPKVTEADGVTTVTISFTIAYEDNEHWPALGPNLKLWSKTQTVKYKRCCGANGFVFDQQASQVSKKEMAAIYESEEPTKDEVLRYNYQQLARLANSKRKRTKEWLKCFLITCSDSPKKRTLLRRLRKVQPILDEQ